jgi:hypothetical protein
MRTTSRLFLAAILFIVAAGIASAQDATAAPPSAAPDVVKPVDQLQPIPFAGTNTAPPEPALTVDPSAVAIEPLVVAPVAAAQVEAPAAGQPVTATVQSVTKRTARKPVVHPSESVKPAAPAIVPAVVETAQAPPAPAAAPIAPPLGRIASPPAAASAVDPLSTTRPQARMGAGSWFLAGIVVVGLVGIITLIRRRKTRTRTSIPDFTAGQDLKPVLAQRH